MTEDVLTKKEALNLEYPYLWEDNEDIRLIEAFDDLRAYTLIFVEKDYIIQNMTIHGRNEWNKRGTVVLVAPWNDSDMLSSYFTEHIRVDCKRSDEKYSPKDYWALNKKAIVADTTPLTSASLNAKIWNTVRGCGMFRPSLMTGWLKNRQAKSVLDFSAGWLDRLIGTIAVDGVRYVGVDPNQALINPFNAIVEQFAEDKDLYTLVSEPFQTAILPDETYDMVLTSPPYFNLEIYSTDATQSYIQGSSLDDWLTTFLFPSLDKAWNVLNPEGIFCIIINDTSRVHYVNAMLQYMESLSNTPVVMIPYVGDDNKAQPMWLWTKRPTIHHVNNLSPDIVINKYNTDAGVTVSVIRDDLLVGGTKQRALIPFLNTIDTHEIVYAGPDTGYAQVAISYVCSLIGKQAVLFLSGISGEPTSHLTKQAIEYGAKVYMMPAKLSTVEAEARKYAARTHDSTRLRFGMNDPIYHYLLVKELSNAITIPEPKRVWTAVGSASLLRVLAKIWPNTYFMAVQVGRTINVADLPYYLRNRVKVIVVPESEYKFRESVKDIDLPPYPSLGSYDAKVWKYVNKQAKDGDYIWNVGQ